MPRRRTPKENVEHHANRKKKAYRAYQSASADYDLAKIAFKKSRQPRRKR